MISGSDILTLAAGGVITLAGRFLWKYLDGKMTGKPKLIWFISHQQVIDVPNTFREQLLKLFTDAEKQNDEWKALNLHNDFVSPIKRNNTTTSVVVSNVGKVPVENVKVLVSGGADVLSIEPDVGIQSKVTADGKTEYELTFIGAKEQIRLTLTNCYGFDIKGVAVSGHQAEEVSGRKLVSERWMERNNASRWEWVFPTILVLIMLASYGGLSFKAWEKLQLSNSEHSSSEKVEQ